MLLQPLRRSAFRQIALDDVFQFYQFVDESKLHVLVDVAPVANIEIRIGYKFGKLLRLREGYVQAVYVVPGLERLWIVYTFGDRYAEAPFVEFDSAVTSATAGLVRHGTFDEKLVRMARLTGQSFRI